MLPAGRSAPEHDLCMTSEHSTTAWWNRPGVDFEEGGKLEYLEKNPRSQIEIDWNSVHIRSEPELNPGHRGGRDGWWPLNHPDFPLWMSLSCWDEYIMYLSRWVRHTPYHYRKSGKFKGNSRESKSTKRNPQFSFKARYNQDLFSLFSICHCHCSGVLLFTERLKKIALVIKSYPRVFSENFLSSLSSIPNMNLGHWLNLNNSYVEKHHWQWKTLQT